MLKKFDKRIDAVMKELGFCCGIKHTFTTRKLYCYGKKGCEIAKNGIYYMFDEK